MAASKEEDSLENLLNIPEDRCVIEATVNTGLEHPARDEVVSKIDDVTVTISRGRLFINLPKIRAKEVLELHSIDNCSVLVNYFHDLAIPDDEVESLRVLRNLVFDINWKGGLEVWQRIFQFPHEIAYKPDIIPDKFDEPAIIFRERKPKKSKENKPKCPKNDWNDASKSAGFRGGFAGGKSGGGGGSGVNEQRDDVGMNIRQEGDVIVAGNNGDNVGNKDANVNTPKSDKNVDPNKGCDVALGDDYGVQNKGCSLTKEICDLKTENIGDKVEVIKQNSDADDTQQKVEVQNTDRNTTQVQCQIGQKSQTPKDEISSNEPENKPEKVSDPTKPTFRVTCNRTGKQHKFTSMCAAANFGGAINEYFKWNVDMKNFDIEVILDIAELDVYVCLALTKESLHRRNLALFGPTTLRPTIAYNLLRLCAIQPGDVVCDPMCGGGSIPIESASEWTSCHHIAGEIHHKAIERTHSNIQQLNSKLIAKQQPTMTIDVLKWDSTRLPLADGCVDVFVTDLPFGKRMGYKGDNWRLYPDILLELARVSKPSSGRACFLTQDRKCFTKSVGELGRYWKRQASLWVNIGGLNAGVFVLNRTASTFGDR